MRKWVAEAGDMKEPLRWIKELVVKEDQILLAKNVSWKQDLPWLIVEPGFAPCEFWGLKDWQGFEEREKILDGTISGCDTD